MAKNFRCTHCPMHYDFPPLRCLNCGNNTIIYDGQADREREQERARAVRQQRHEADQRARLENDRLAKRKREQIEAEARKEKVKKHQPTPKSSPRPKSKPKWSWGAGIIGFLIGSGVGMEHLGLDREAALIFGGIAGLIFGFYYKTIIVLAIVALIAYSILQKQ